MRSCPAFLALLLICAGCAAVPGGTMPIRNSAQSVPVPSATRVLGQAVVYVSATGEKLEIVHDATAGIAIVKRPDERITILSAEIAGSEERYRDEHMTLWENAGGVLLWIDGALVFSGRMAK